VLPEYLLDLGLGVYAVDTGFERERFDAAYLVVSEGRAAFVDTGTAFALPRLLGALEALGLAREAADWVIPTHVHLDHAGGAGQLMRALPNARLLVHPRGARHLADPSALWQAASAVYGPEQMARAYGELLPVGAQRITESAEGQRVALGGRTLEVAFTPGHARHHHCLWDETSRGWFSGDTFGARYPEFITTRGSWMAPIATPAQFEPELLAASVRRLLARNPACIYVTHFGRVDDVVRAGTMLLAQLEQLVALALAQRFAADRHQALRRAQAELYGASLAEHGCTVLRERVLELLELDLELNAQGLAIWLDKPEGTPSASRRTV
jgi:glyoxylase-like metal-dependent hydrolase (beta-lactamase superfamily II)